MDPMFGLPCVQESRAMDNARTKNQSQEKQLAEKFESLDLDMKTRSGKLLSQRSEVEDFMSRLEVPSQRHALLPAGLSHRERSMYRKMARCAGLSSMSLAEFDRVWRQRPTHTRSRHVAFTKNVAARPRIVLDSNAARRVVQRNHPTASPDKEEDRVNEKSLVDPGALELCLPMNRQKHAVRDVWSRITSEDMRHKTEIKKAASAPDISTQSQPRAKTTFFKHECNEKVQESRAQGPKSAPEQFWKPSGRRP